MIAPAFASNSIDLARPVNWRHSLAVGMSSFWHATASHNGTTLRDLGTGRYDGTLNDGYFFGATSSGEFGLRFNGSTNYVFLPDDVLTSFSTPAVVAVCFVTGSSASTGHVFSNQGLGGASSRFYIRASNTTIDHQAGNSGAFGSTSVLARSKHTAFLVQSGSGTFTAWVDGRVTGSATPATGSINQTWALGSYGRGTSNFFAGDILSCAIWTGTTYAASYALHREMMNDYPGLLNRIEVPLVGSVQGGFNPAWAMDATRMQGGVLSCA